METKLFTTLAARLCTTLVVVVRWWPGVVVSSLASINKVNQHRAWLVLRWVTVSGFNSWCGTFISVCGQPPRATQPGHPFVGRHNEYQPKGGDALLLGSKGRYGYVCGWQVTLCDPLVTHGPYLSALAVVLPIIRRYTNNHITLTQLLLPRHSDK